MNIREFIVVQRTKHLERYHNQSAAEVLLKTVPPEISDWTEVFRGGGYHMVNANAGQWAEMHQWCVEHFGAHYAWTGNNFWFETEQDAIMFALKWS